MSKGLRRQVNDAVDSDVKRIEEHGKGFSYVRKGPLLLEELEDVCRALDLTPGLRQEATRETCRRAIREELPGDGNESGKFRPSELHALIGLLDERGGGQ